MVYAKVRTDIYKLENVSGKYRIEYFLLADGIETIQTNFYRGMDESSFTGHMGGATEIIP